MTTTTERPSSDREHAEQSKPPQKESSNLTEEDVQVQAALEDVSTDEASSDEGGLEARLDKALSDAKEHHDRYLRTLAESENARKRWQKERSDLQKYANEGLLKDLLPVLDSFQKAEESMQADDLESVKSGVELVRKQLIDALAKNGLQEVESISKGAFNPEVHQAIQRIEGDVDQDVVGEEFQKGYTLNGRLLRASMVSVIVPGSHQDEGGN